MVSLGMGLGPGLAMVSNDGLVVDFEAGSAPGGFEGGGFEGGGFEGGGFEALIAVATEVKKAQSAAFSGLNTDLQDFGSFCLRDPVGLGW
ncbi:hypothetical protein OAF53_01025 [Akkermansiaceae bacterium]|nr:hypothetical protein [bacterium]MDB2430152.1 hypothetical protein [Akkermansiaceae bacterium]MDB4735259.1 hypothetical protein [Akkermansiaceae bacterium]